MPEGSRNNHEFERRGGGKPAQSHHRGDLAWTPKSVDSSTRWLRTAGAHRLTKLGFIISQITASRYPPRRPAEPDQVKRRMALLRNHKVLNQWSARQWLHG